MSRHGTGGQRTEQPESLPRKGWTLEERRQRAEEWRKNEPARVQELHDRVVAKRQKEAARRAAAVGKLSEVDLAELLELDGDALTLEVLKRVETIHSEALTAERPDFRTALACTSALLKLVRERREDRRLELEAKQTPTTNWLTEGENDGEDDAAPDDIATIDTEVGDALGRENRATAGSELSPPITDPFPPRRQDESGRDQAEPSDAEPLASAGDDKQGPDAGAAPREPGDGPEQSELAGSFAAAVAGAMPPANPDPCPACCKPGGLVLGKVISGVQWLDCRVCGRTEVKRA